MTRALPLLAIAAAAACGPAPRATGGDIAHRVPSPPPTVDTDDDGVPDARDACPREAEDDDLFADDDGCPDLDDDGDGVPDAKDACFDLPGTNGHGCPDGCTIITTTDDCFFLTPIWSPTMPAAALAATKKVFDAYPEIRVVTLTPTSATGENPERAYERALQATRALVAAGVPATKLEIDTKLMPDQPGEKVFGQITKQRFSPGKFRSTHCAGGIGAVYRVQREHNYHCHPVVCGDGICDLVEEPRCFKDCPP